MGNRGPIPKRDDERRRRNKPVVETTVVEADVDPEYVVPEADPKWHPIASQWYLSLAQSAQAEFYQPSDWATAYILAESISRDLNPQFVAVSETTGEAIYERIPMKGASLSAYLKGFTALMVTEGDRRRARMEIEREQPAPAKVASLAEKRASRLA